MNYLYENMEQYNLNKEQEILIVSDETVADMLSNKNIIQ